MRSTRYLSVAFILVVAVFFTLKFMPRHDVQETQGLPHRQAVESYIALPVESERESSEPEKVSPVRVVKTSAQSAKPASLKKSPAVAPNLEKEDGKDYASGEVSDPSGKPLAGADVIIGGAWFTRAVADSAGKFRIEVPPLESNPGG